MTAEGEIIQISPVDYQTGVSITHVAGERHNWADKDQLGLASSSSAGIVLPNGARRSPRTAWTSIVCLDATDIRKKGGFLHLCPEFVVEVRSFSDRLPALRRKMREYMENGFVLDLTYVWDPLAD